VRRRKSNPLDLAYDTVIQAFNKVEAKHFRFWHLDEDEQWQLESLIALIGTEGKVKSSFANGELVASLTYYPTYDLHLLVDRHRPDKVAVLFKTNKPKKLGRVLVEAQAWAMAHLAQ